MAPNRFGKRGRDPGPSATVYRDRTTWAIDAQLASLASSGDDSAFTTLVTRFHPAVFRWALMFASDPDEAEDITQEVFVRTYRHLGEYRSDGPLDAWLYRITRRAATQMRRTRNRRGRLVLSPAAQPTRDVYTTDPGGRVDRERAASVIRELFGELPRRQREIFELVDLQVTHSIGIGRERQLKPIEPVCRTKFLPQVAPMQKFVFASWTCTR